MNTSLKRNVFGLMTQVLVPGGSSTNTGFLTRRKFGSDVIQNESLAVLASYDSFIQPNNPLGVLGDNRHYWKYDIGRRAK